MLQRMLIDKMENRILVGITAFVGVMILIGWVAINENARMRSFERQFLARSIERGAETFAANCSTCHGADGRGITGRAPALNSPHFFGFDFFADINNQISTLQAEENVLNAELDNLREELVTSDNAERRDEILERRDQITTRITGESGIRAQIEALQAQKVEIATALQPAVDNGYPLVITVENEVTYVDADLDPTTQDGPGRLEQINWGSTLYNYAFTTLVHGRPTSLSYWGGGVQMVAWGQDGGGPLRDDEIGDVVNFILNWDKGNDWTVEDALLVNQYSRIPGQGGAVEVTGEPAGTDVQAIVQRITDEGITGDPARGEQLYAGRTPSQIGIRLACSGCHLNGSAGPLTAEQWDNIESVRFPSDPALFEGYTPEEYVIESVVQTNAYIVDGYSAGAMPQAYGSQISVQDLADIVTYIRSQSTTDTDHSDSFLQEGTGGATSGTESDSGAEGNNPESTPEPAVIPADQPVEATPELPAEGAGN